MVKSFKALILDLARLPRKDQRWVIKHLSETQQARFQQLDGLSLLKAAQRFRRVQQVPVIDQVNPSSPEPTDYQALAKQTPLYAAIVLDQSEYSWREGYLKTCDQEGVIRSLLVDTIPDLKAATKQAVFQAWQQANSFIAFLEQNDG